MKGIVVAGIITGLLATASVAAADCTAKGHRLFGRVQVVRANADLKVRVVRAFPQLRVELVTAFADRCGRWRMVDSLPDFTIQLVESFPDLTISYVTSFPGTGGGR